MQRARIITVDRWNEGLYRHHKKIFTPMQFIVYLTLPMMSDSNGTIILDAEDISFELMKKNEYMEDVQFVINYMLETNEAEKFTSNCTEYLYLKTFLNEQTLTSMAKLPSHPCVKFFQIGKRIDYGRHFDTRRIPEDIKLKLERMGATI